MNNNPSKKEIINQAIQFHLRGNIQEATKYYQFCINNEFNDHTVFSNYGAILQSLDKLKEAHKQDRNNPDILNYLGFTLRKTGKFEEAEKHYLAGLKIKPNHNGINEYLGELYVKTGRVELAKERLAVLKNCNCEEYAELKEVIEKN